MICINLAAVIVVATAPAHIPIEKDVQAYGSCPPGKFLHESTFVLTKKNYCYYCPPGKYSLGTRDKCQSCSPGKFQYDYDKDVCELCPLGKYITSEGMKECKACEKKPQASNRVTCR
jgi:hypothetical protein